MQDLNETQVVPVTGLRTDSARNAWKRRGTIVANFVGVQLLVQFMSLVTGFMLVRTMSKTEYAFYTVAATMQGTMNMLADSGVGSALSATGGSVWQDRHRLGQLVQTGLEFRRKFGTASILVIGPVLWWMLFSNGASAPYALLLTTVVVAAASAQLAHGAYSLVLRLHTQVRELQHIDLVSALLRLVLLAVACLLGVNAFIAITVAVIALGLQNFKLKKSAKVNADLTAMALEDDRKTIWLSVRRQAPNSIYYCFQGQLVVFLITIFADAHSIANVGALGRLTIFFSIVSSVMTNLVLPRFARCQDARRLKSMYVQIIGGFVVFSVLCTVLASFLSGPLLWLLGSKYMHLRHELVYVVFGAALSTTGGVIYSLNAARGWLQSGWLAIPISLGIQILLIPVLDLRTVEGAVLLSSLPVIPSVLPFMYRAWRQFQEMARQLSEPQVTQ